MYNLLILVLLLLSEGGVSGQSSHHRHRALQPEEPRPLFFRYMEGPAQSGRPVETWNESFGQLMGLIAKAQSEGFGGSVIADCPRSLQWTRPVC